MPVKGNKGEWSEFYAFIKILTDGELYAADENLELLRDKFFTVLKIIRQEKTGKIFYDISANDGKVIITNQDGETIGNLELQKIKSGVASIFSEMKEAASTTFEVSLANETMEDLHCTQIKASSGRKSDLSIVIHDRISPTFPELGFSIKSMLGSPSTLLNSSGVTNFVFDVNGITEDQSIEANAIVGRSKIRKRAKYIKERGGEIIYSKMDSEAFRRNLRRIESNLPEIVGEMLKCYFAGKGSKISELVDCISENNELCERLEMSKEDYTHKVKNFLSAIALGMTPKKEWDGFTQTHGGYIIVKENGEIVCYHLYNRDEFEEYLFQNTKFDTPSSGRHGFGELYDDSGQMKIKYNLQVRFLQ